MRARLGFAAVTAISALLALTIAGQASAAPKSDSDGANPRAAAVAAYWTAAKRAAAIPRDIVVDANGHSFIGAPGNLRPYGGGASVFSVLSADPVPAQKPSGSKGGGGGGDTMPPTIGTTVPADGALLTKADAVFSATVSDSSGVKSVAFVITAPTGLSQTFSASSAGADLWTISFTGFSDGDWLWQVVAKDNGLRGGNTATSDPFAFTVKIGGGTTPPPSGSGNVASAPWTTGSSVQSASGRLLFEMPTNKRGNRWQAYVCSATAVADGSLIDGTSLILTAAHCVYDEENGFFARNAMFIPDQSATTGARTDSDCSNDPIGCWAPSFGVVDQQWTDHAWPSNIPWDYGYYVVSNASSAHTGPLPAGAVDFALENNVPAMTVSFSQPAQTRTSAFGYSYSEDPKQMFCAQNRGFTGGGTPGISDNWWLDQCGLTGGASGGPWLDETSATSTTGEGQIISVNSWGYSGSPGMAGPKLDGSASTVRDRLPECVFKAATTAATNTKVSGTC